MTVVLPEVPPSEPSTSQLHIPSTSSKVLPTEVPSSLPRPTFSTTIVSTSQTITTVSPPSSLLKSTFTAATIVSTSKVIESVKTTEEKRSVTPQNASIVQNTSKCLSTPSRKASHIRTLKFATPLKSGQTPDVSSSAPATIERSRKVIDQPQLDIIDERLGNSANPPPLEGELETAQGTIASNSSSLSIALMNENSMSNTPKVAKNPRSCVRVLSRSASENGDEEKDKKEPVVPAKKPIDPDMEEWNRVRLQSSGRNFDQYLRKQQEEQMRLEQMNAKKKKRIRKKKVPQEEPAVKSTNLSNISTDLDVESDPNNSLTDAHAKQLEDALKSAKKGEKIFVKIQTPKKKTPTKKSPKKKRRINNAKMKRNKFVPASEEVIENKSDKDGISSPKKETIHEKNMQVNNVEQVIENEENPNQLHITKNSEYFNQSYFFIDLAV